MTEPEKVDEKTRAELNMLYEATGNDLREIKRQQWTVTYYGLLLYAALVGYVAFRTGPESSRYEFSYVEKAALVALAELMAVFGSWYLVKCQKSLAGFRAQAERIENHWSHQTKEALKGNPRYTSTWYHFEILLALIVTLVAGGAVVCWVLLYSLTGLVLFLGVALVFVLFSMIWLHCTDSSSAPGDAAGKK